MHTYLSQLLADLKAAETHERPTKPDYKLLYPDHPAADPQYGGHMDYMIEWEMNIGYTAEELWGIRAEAFPPVEKLEDAQVESLAQAILNLWAAYNIGVSFPEEGDTRVLYNWLVNHWATGGDTGNFPLINDGGHCTTETCHYDPTDCIWGEACTCKDFEAWEMPEQTPEEKAYWEKGLQAGGGWINPDLLDENGNFDPSKLDNLRFPDEDDDALPF